MSEIAAPLHMVQATLDSRALFRLPAILRVSRHRTDPGYLCHCLVKSLFGDRAPTPFHISNTAGRWVTVLGYSKDDANTLRELARATALPDAFQVVDWDGWASKAMPEQWSGGRTLAFDLRACPVVRKASAGPKHRAGAEVDVFLSACWEAGSPDVPVNREQVYRTWLAQQFQRHGGAKLLEMRMNAFKRTPLMRRTQGEKRSGRLCERPDAHLSGVLEVTDGDAFGHLLARGIGRHRAFGYGMLLLHNRV